MTLKASLLIGNLRYFIQILKRGLDAVIFVEQGTISAPKN
jgi:hypothetical protein